MSGKENEVPEQLIVSAQGKGPDAHPKIVARQSEKDGESSLLVTLEAVPQRQESDRDQKSSQPISSMPPTQVRNISSLLFLVWTVVASRLNQN